MPHPTTHSGFQAGARAGPLAGLAGASSPRSSDRPTAAPLRRAPREVAPDHPLLGALVLAIACVWIAVPLLALAEGREALQNLGIAGSCALAAVGVAQLLWALDVLLRRKTLTVGENALQMAERSLLGVRRWREPIACFRGLRHRRQRVRGPRGFRVVHRLELVHPEPAKSICLLTTRDERRVAAAARQWAQWLGLPGSGLRPRRTGAEPALSG
jgi:hypothetical protein